METTSLSLPDPDIGGFSGSAFGGAWRRGARLLDDHRRLGFQWLRLWRSMETIRVVSTFSQPLCFSGSAFGGAWRHGKKPNLGRTRRVSVAPPLAEHGDDAHTLGVIAPRCFSGSAFGGAWRLAVGGRHLYLRRVSVAPPLAEHGDCASSHIMATGRRFQWLRRSRSMEKHSVRPSRFRPSAFQWLRRSRSMETSQISSRNSGRWAFQLLHSLWSMETGLRRLR